MHNLVCSRCILVQCIFKISFNYYYFLLYSMLMRIRHLAMT
jgi:hypothetical protein